MSINTFEGMIYLLTCVGLAMNWADVMLAQFLVRPDLISGHEPALVEWEYLPHVGPRQSKGFVGLKNAGATCYMNAVLQQVRKELLVYPILVRSMCNIG